MVDQFEAIRWRREISSLESIVLRFQKGKLHIARRGLVAIVQMDQANEEQTSMCVKLDD